MYPVGPRQQRHVDPVVHQQYLASRLHHGPPPAELVGEPHHLHRGDGSGHAQDNDLPFKGFPGHESITSCTTCHVWGA